jgi:lactoylglutathione lyase
MKRFHVHVHVTDLSKNIDFYSKMFGAQPARVESDYAKWMLDEPAVNFAISTRGHGHTGVDHLGIQVDNDADLIAQKAQAQAADLALIDEGATTCCYAKSDKHWVVDPQGVPWEHFHTLGSIPVFREADAVAGSDQAPVAEAGGCCTPKVTGKPIGIPVKSSCC